MRRLLYLVTIPLSARSFLSGQLGHFCAAGDEVHLASSPRPLEGLQQVAANEGVEAHPLPLEREISLWRDATSLFSTWRLLNRLRPQIVNAGTPKAGLIGNVAAVLARVPVRVYVLHGLRLETTTGLKRRLLTMTERLACSCAHRVICVSPSVRQRALQLGVVKPHKALVLGSGTCNGIRAERFMPSRDNLAQAGALREKLSLPEGTPTVGFVGRFVKDKGIGELLEAFDQLYRCAPQARLLLLGDYEEGDPVDAEVRAVLETHPGVVRAGFVGDTAPYYHLMDVLVLPTYREGFPTAPLEAGAAGKPVVTTTATGAVDSVLDGITGLIVPVGDSCALAEALRRLLEDKALARRLGQAGQERVLREFQPERIWRELDHLYQTLLAERRGRRGLTLKRAVDMLASGLGLTLLALPMLFIAWVVRRDLGSPVLFKQRRPGLHGRPFTMYKFRTMRDATDAGGRPLPDHERLTPLGRFLRATSLDELPELLNVLRGDMSMVGPRPLLMDYLDRYTPEQARRHEVRPGVTGWAQVNGRNAISWEEKFRLDVWYVDHRSLRLDLKILWLTVLKVFKREGISAAGEATMPVFTGTPRSEA